MNDTKTELSQELWHQLGRMQSAQQAFSKAQAAARQLLCGLSAERGSGGEDEMVSSVELLNLFSYVLNQQASLQTGDGEAEAADADLGVPIVRAMPPIDEINESEVSDHYVEAPFADPFDCFEDMAPVSPFPSLEFHETPDQEHRNQSLRGLFESDPESEQGGAAQDRSEVEIEFLEDGGYRMISTPRKRKAWRRQHLDDVDGMAS